jgi:hypothetical protein
MGFNGIPHGIYHLVMTNSLPWKDPPFLSSVNHLFLWAIYTMAMLNNQRVFWKNNNKNPQQMQDAGGLACPKILLVAGMIPSWATGPCWSLIILHNLH